MALGRDRMTCYENRSVTSSHTCQNLSGVLNYVAKFVSFFKSFETQNNITKLVFVFIPDGHNKFVRELISDNQFITSEYASYSPIMLFSTIGDAGIRGKYPPILPACLQRSYISQKAENPG